MKTLCNLMQPKIEALLMTTVRINFNAKTLAALPPSSTSLPDKFKDEGGPQSRREMYLYIGRTTKVFYFVRKINGKTIRHRVGEFPATTIEQARKRCKELSADADKGINPVEQKRKARHKGLSFAGAFEQYIEDASTRATKPLRQSTVTNYTRSVDTHLSDFSAKPCSEIEYTDVQSWYNKCAKLSPTAANSALRVGRAVFNHQIDIANRQQSGAFRSNPFQGHKLIAEKARAECIEFAELPDWFGAVRKLQSETTRDFLTLLLFTGLRRREASTLTWRDIDLRKRTLTAKNTKNGTNHTLPLSTPVHELLTSRKLDSVDEWVFPSYGASGHIEEPKKAVARVTELSGVQCSPHGLRRTFSNIAAFKARVPEPVRKLLMNHAPDRRDVTGFNYTNLPLEELRPFMQDIADAILEGAKQPKPLAEVVTLGVVNG